MLDSLRTIAYDVESLTGFVEGILQEGVIRSPGHFLIYYINRLLWATGEAVGM